MGCLVAGYQLKSIAGRIIPLGLNLRDSAQFAVPPVPRGA
jgi:hypothetical protein